MRLYQRRKNVAKTSSSIALTSASSSSAGLENTCRAKMLLAPVGRIVYDTFEFDKIITHQPVVLHFTRDLRVGISEDAYIRFGLSSRFQAPVQALNNFLVLSLC